MFAVSDPRFAEIIGGHLDFDFIANADANEIFAHLTRNMSENFVAVGEGDAEHGSRQHLSYRAHQFDWFFFGHGWSTNDPESSGLAERESIIFEDDSFQQSEVKIRLDFTSETGRLRNTL